MSSALAVLPGLPTAREVDGRWFDEDGNRVGVQLPRIRLVPPCASSRGADAIDLLGMAGIVPDPWEQQALQDTMGVTADGKWAALRAALIVPRQNGKNLILEGVELVHLYLDGHQVVHTAHRFSTAKRAFESMLARIRSNPALWAEVKGAAGLPTDAKVRSVEGLTDSGTECSIELRNGAKIEYRTRSAHQARGFTADLVVLDEAYALKRAEVAALLPTMASRARYSNPQVWYTSSAGMPSSEVLADLRLDGVEGQEGLCYLEWSNLSDDERIELDLPERDDDDLEAEIEDLYAANPGMGYRLTIDWTLGAEKAGMTAEEYLRERRGIWARVGGDTFIPKNSWAACKRTDLLEHAQRHGGIIDLVHDIRIGIDVSPDRARASICLAGLLDDGTVYVEHIDGGDGTDWLVSTAVPIWERRSEQPILVAGASTAADLARDLRRTGAVVRLLPTEKYASACGRFLDAVRRKQIAHLGQDELTASVAAAAPSHGNAKLFTWKRTNVASDLTPLVAATVATAPLWRTAAASADVPAPERGGRRTRPVRPRTRPTRPIGGARA